MTQSGRIPPAPRRHLARPIQPVLPEEKFTFFWHGPFSQWHASRFEIDGVSYSHAEQWMMAEKARLFGDADVERQIMAATNPKAQKALGRKVRGFDERIWNANAKPIVKNGSLAKFSQNSVLLEALLATDGTTLVEASPYDKVWGIGLAIGDPRSLSRSTWQGTNWLGEVLTETREELALLRKPALSL